MIPYCATISPIKNEDFSFKLHIKVNDYNLCQSD